MAPQTFMLKEFVYNLYTYHQSVVTCCAETIQRRDGQNGWAIIIIIIAIIVIIDLQPDTEL